MRTLIKLVVFLCIFGGIGAAIYFPSAKYLRERNKPKYRLEPVVEGDITLNVNATGTVEPVLRVTVGAVVSGPIEELFVDFNDHVTKGQTLLEIDLGLQDEVELTFELPEHPTGASIIVTRDGTWVETLELTSGSFTYTLPSDAEFGFEISTAGARAPTVPVLVVKPTPRHPQPM